MDVAGQSVVGEQVIGWERPGEIVDLDPVGVCGRGNKAARMPEVGVQRRRDSGADRHPKHLLGGADRRSSFP